MLIKNHKDKILASEIDHLRKERRTQLNKQDFEAYRKIVIEMMKLEHNVINGIQ